MKKVKNFGMLGLFLFFSIGLINDIMAVDYFVTYNSSDATSNIQAGLDSGADRVILTYQGANTKWISGPLAFSNSNMELVLENGVILEAKSGAFTSLTTPFIAVSSKSNVTITGYGATVRMLINEYTSGEWRHCLLINNCINITVSGVTLEKSGGDGIYLGAPCNDTVIIEDVTCNGNGRNGISVISAKNVTIDGCEMSNTGLYNPTGLAASGPCVGIDFEPNSATETLQNITLVNCAFNNNKQEGIRFALGNLNSTTPDVSIAINNCDILGSQNGIWFAPAAGAVSGTIDFEDCVIEDPVVNAVKISNWTHDGIDVIMTNCTLINPAESSSHAAVEIITDANITYKTGNFVFSNLYVLESVSPYVLTLTGANQDYKIEDVTAVIYTDSADTCMLYNDYYNNISTAIFRPVVGFDTAFSSSADNIGGTDSEVFLTSSDAQVYPGDYNGDGKADFFVKGYGTYRALYTANSSGTGFARQFLGITTDVGGTDVDSFLTSSDAKVYPGDYNGDGKTDLFVKGYGTYRVLYLANSSGTGFTRPFMGSGTGTVGGIDAWVCESAAQVYPGDYNGDGKADLFVKGYGTYRALYTANSSGTGFDCQFSSDADSVGGTDSEPFLTSADSKLYLGDYNGDGKTDFFVKGCLTFRTLYLANSSGTGFNRAFLGYTEDAGGTDVDPFLTSSDAKVYPGDYNGDGKTDLFVKGYSTYRVLYTADSNGTGFVRQFASAEDDDCGSVGGLDNEVFLTSSDAQVYPGDYNGDGKTDLFVKGYQAYRLLYIANSSGTGFSRHFLGDGLGVGGTAADGRLTDSSALVYPGDYNGDGKTDLFVKGYGTYRTLYTASGTYQP